VVYCGHGCQRRDWMFHKAVCVVMKSGLRDSRAVGDDAKAPQLHGTAGGIRIEPVEVAPIDVVLTGGRSLKSAQSIVHVLQKRGVCVVKANADKQFQQALSVEARNLWDAGQFRKALRGKPCASGSNQVMYDERDDQIVWLTKTWKHEHEQDCKALIALDKQLGDFGWGLSKFLEVQLGLDLVSQTPGMLSCYAGDVKPGARYDFHVDNPYQTSMRVPDDKRRLTVIYYLGDESWDIHRNGGALQFCLTDPSRAPTTLTDAASHTARLTVAPSCDTLVVFFSHTMYHAVLPLTSAKRRFAFSTWFLTP